MDSKKGRKSGAAGNQIRLRTPVALGSRFGEWSVCQTPAVLPRDAGEASPLRDLRRRKACSGEKNRCRRVVVVLADPRRVRIWIPAFGQRGS